MTENDRPQPGWYADPHGRFQQRYWNGTKWTEHVAVDGSQQVDALETTTPETTTPAKTRPTVIGFLDSLGPDARRRPDPEAAITLGGLGGLVTAAGVLLLSVDDIGDTDDARTKLLLYAALVTVPALVVRLFVQQRVLRSAAVGAGALGIGALGYAITWDDVGDSWALLIIAALYLLAFVLPGFRGRPLLLGIGSLASIAALASATQGSNSFGDSGLLPSEVNDVLGDQGPVFLLAGAALLGIVYLLDRAGYAGIATSLVVAALVATAVGVGLVAADLDQSSSSLLVIASGVVVCMVGGHGERRATAWIGGGVAAIGVVTFMQSVMEPDSVSAAAGMLLISGLLLIVAPLVINAVRSKTDPDSPTTPTGFDPPTVQ